MIYLLAVIFLSIIVLVHEFGHFCLAKSFRVKVEEFGLGYPPCIFSKKLGGTKYSINAIPFGGFNKISETDLLRQPPLHKSAIFLGGVLFNLMLGFLLFVMVSLIGTDPVLLINKVFPGSPAEQAGLQVQDQIINLSYGQQRLDFPFTGEQMIQFLNQQAGKKITLKIRRNGNILTKSIVPRVSPPSGEGKLGIGFFDAGIPKQSFLGSLAVATRRTFWVIRATLQGLYKIITQSFVKPELLQDVVGPVGMVFFAYKIGQIGLIYLVQVMASISVGLAVFNLLPFPALDGMFLVYTAIEKIKGRPLSKKIVSTINAYGFIFLLILAILLVFKDIRMVL